MTAPSPFVVRASTARGNITCNCPTPEWALRKLRDFLKAGHSDISIIGPDGEVLTKTTLVEMVEGTPAASGAPAGLEGFNTHLDDIVRSLLAFSASYQPGTIIEGERVVDAYLTQFEGYQACRVAMDALLQELASPAHRARNRGGLFELIELHLKRRHREMARQFQ